MKNYKQKIISFIAKLNRRERTFAVLAILVIVVMVGSSAIEPIQKIFSAQSAILKKSQDELALVPTQLERYIKLDLRQSEIEKKYQSVEFKTGVFSYMESLISSTTGVTSSKDYSIKPLPPSDFGGSYIQEPWRIEVHVTAFDKAVEFVKEIARGKHPLVLTRMNFKKSPNNSRLTVQVDVSNFKPKLQAVAEENEI